MRQAHKAGSWEKFYHFIETPVKDLGNELESYGADIHRLSDACRKLREPSWLSKARAAQRDFESNLKKKRAWISDRFKSAKEMLDAISSGSLGSDVQNHAMVFFRNRSEADATESELREFINDCEILGLVKSDDSSG